MCEVADTKRHGIQIDAGRGNHIQFLSIRLYKVEARGAGVGSLQRALAAFGEHVWVYVCDGDFGVGVVVDGGGVVEHAEGDVAGAAGYVEDVHALLLVTGGGEGVAAWVQVADEVVFPEAVDS